MRCKGKVTGATWSLSAVGSGSAVVITESGRAEGEKKPGSLKVSLTTVLAVDCLPWGFLWHEINKPVLN